MPASNYAEKIFSDVLLTLRLPPPQQREIERDLFERKLHDATDEVRKKLGVKVFITILPQDGEATYSLSGTDTSPMGKIRTKAALMSALDSQGIIGNVPDGHFR